MARSAIVVSHALFPLVTCLAAVLAACGSEGSGKLKGQVSDAGTGGAASGGTTSGNGGTGNGGAASGGAANGGSASGGSAGSGGSGNGGSGSLVNPAPGSKFFVGANFWNIDWEGADDYFQNGVDFATTTNPWRPELLTDLAPYAVLRFMDWNAINTTSNSQAVWSTRKQKTAAQNEPVAFEWQIDLCNRAKKDYWLNIPHEAGATYWQNLATLVHDQLDPTLRVYVEWSNEVWNGGFPQKGYAETQASTLGLAGSMPSASYYVYEAVRVFEAFDAVFGTGSPRLVKVLAGQSAWTGPCDAHAIALADTQINPNGTKPDVYAVAPYLTGVTVTELTPLPNVASWVQADKTCADSLGVPLISYEGGSDSFAAASCQAVQVDAAMYGIYGSYLDAVSGAGLTGPFMQYTHTGSCWGLKVKTGDALSASPKYRAVVDWLAAH